MTDTEEILDKDIKLIKKCFNVDFFPFCSYHVKQFYEIFLEEGNNKPGTMNIIIKLEKNSSETCSIADLRVGATKPCGLPAKWLISNSNSALKGDNLWELQNKFEKKSD